MTHGSQQYFIERTRFETRLTAITLLVAVGLLVLLFAAERTPLREALSDPEHFGFEGPENYVHRIELEAYGTRSEDRNQSTGVNVVQGSARGGGSGRAHARLDPHASTPSTGESGTGDAAEDLLTRALRPSSNVPIVRSDELIFERLVRPGYPDAARERGIEGRFAVLALIDTTGHVVEVQIETGDPNGILERAALSAVRECVIRPNWRGLEAHEFVARFPFNFYLRD